MHVIEHIIMAEKEAQEQASKKGNNNSNNSKSDPKRLQALEAKAVAAATATADASYVPTPSLLNASTVAPLLKQVDGPSLASYEGKESIYVGRSVPVAAGGTLTVPIQVSAPGSVVEYAVENKMHDFAFGITAEREEGVTIVKVKILKKLSVVDCKMEGFLEVCKTMCAFSHGHRVHTFSHVTSFSYAFPFFSFLLHSWKNATMASSST